MLEKDIVECEKHMIFKKRTFTINKNLKFFQDYIKSERTKSLENKS